MNHSNQDQGQFPAQDPPNMLYSRQVFEVVSYKECLKNHAASIGGNATDGCGEFMPSIDGVSDPFEAMKCSACGCHRNFHRKEVEGESSRHHSPHYYNNNNNHHQAIGFLGRKKAIPVGHNNKSMQLGQFGMGGASTPSESNDNGDGDAFCVKPAQRKKRYRTKFSQEQKEKLLSFAEKAGWKMQKLDESVVQQFCQEIGIKRKVLKVWMHNNKHNYVDKNLHF